MTTVFDTKHETVDDTIDRLLVDLPKRDPERPARVAFITRWVRGGGPAWSQYYLLKTIDRKRIEPVVILPARGIFEQRLAALGIESVIPKHFPEAPSSQRFKWDNAITRTISAILNSIEYIILGFRLVRIYKRQNVDLVYCNEILAGIFGAPAAQLAGIPCVLHIRALDDPSNKLNWLWHLIGFRVVTAVKHLPVVRRVIANSRATAAAFRGKVAQKVRVVHNGVDLSEYDVSKVPSGVFRREMGIAPDATVVGFTGHIQPRKGIDTLVRAAAKVAKTRSDVVFVVVGANPVGSAEDYRAQYEALARKHGIADRFLFAGFREDVRYALKDFNIHVLPSYQEAFGRAIIEAMALELPVVASRVGGIPEIITHNVNGLLVPPGDADALAEQIGRLVDSPKLRSKLGEAAVTRVRERFDVTALTRRMEELFVDALQEHSPEAVTVRERIATGEMAVVHAEAV